LFHAFRHHRVVVERIAELNEMEYDHLRDIEPVSARARDKAMHFLSRRPDLTNGMSVAATPDGGIVMDFIRNGREYLVKIESKGNISIIAGTDGENRTPVSIMSRGIDRDFLQELAEEIPDPLSPEVQRGEGAYQSPVPGCVFRSIRPLIPTTCAHLFRGIRPLVTRCREAVGWGYQV